MSANGHGSPEDIFDQALQELLAGSSLEEIVARHPEARGQDLGPLLSTARAVQQGPHPELPRASVAALVARAQAYAQSTAGAEADHRAAALSMVAVDAQPHAVSATAVPSGSQAAAAPVRAASSWVGRLFGWMRPVAPALRATTVLAVLLLAVGGLLMFARNTQKPPVIAVPTFTSVGFSFDAPVQAIDANRWTVGGMVIDVDRNTQIVGIPAIGAQAHVEGALIAGARRLATSITILQPVSIATPTERLPGIATPAGSATGIVPALPAPTLVGEGTSVAPTPASQAGPGTPTKSAAAAVATMSPTVRGGPIAVPTRTPALTATRLPATATLHPTMWPTLTRMPVFTRTPEPARTATYTRTVEPSPTERPSPTELATQTPEPTSEPEETPTAQVTSQPEPSHTPEREPSDTPAPEVTRTPTTSPSYTPTGEPTGEPEETRTAVPVSTATPLSTATRLASPTHEPEGTRTVEPTSSPEGTQEPWPSPTHSN